MTVRCEMFVGVGSFPTISRYIFLHSICSLVDGKPEDGGDVVPQVPGAQGRRHVQHNNVEVHFRKFSRRRGTVHGSVGSLRRARVVHVDVCYFRCPRIHTGIFHRTKIIRRNSPGYVGKRTVGAFSTVDTIRGEYRRWGGHEHEHRSRDGRRQRHDKGLILLIVLCYVRMM